MADGFLRTKKGFAFVIPIPISAGFCFWIPLYPDFIPDHVQETKSLRCVPELRGGKMTTYQPGIP